MEPPINLLSLNPPSSFSPHRHSLTMLLTTYIFRNNGAILLPLPCSFLPVSLLCFRPHPHRSRSVCVLINVPQRQTEMKKKTICKMNTSYLYFVCASTRVLLYSVLFYCSCYRSAMFLCALLPLLLDHAPSRPETTGIISILLPAASESAQKEEKKKKSSCSFTPISS